MMGIMVPETCRASNKICNKNHLLHLVGILFPHTNDNALSKPHQKLNVSKLREWEVGYILKCILLFTEFKFKKCMKYGAYEQIQKQPLRAKRTLAVSGYDGI